MNARVLLRRLLNERFPRAKIRRKRRTDQLSFIPRMIFSMHGCPISASLDAPSMKTLSHPNARTQTSIVSLKGFCNIACTRVFMFFGRLSRPWQSGSNGDCFCNQIGQIDVFNLFLLQSFEKAKILQNHSFCLVPVTWKTSIFGQRCVWSGLWDILGQYRTIRETFWRVWTLEHVGMSGPFPA